MQTKPNRTVCHNMDCTDGDMYTTGSRVDGSNNQQQIDVDKNGNRLVPLSIKYYQTYNS